MRIIHILPYSSLMVDSKSEVNIFADGWHSRVAQQIQKYYGSKYQMECWRPEWKLKKATSEEKDGILYRAFPSYRPTLGPLNKLIYKGVMATLPSTRLGLWREYSLPLLRELKKQCQDGKTLVHIYHIHWDLSYMICLCLHNIPIIGWHIGDTPYTYSLSTFLYHLPFSIVEQRALKNVDAILLGGKWIRDGFIKCYKPVPKLITPMPIAIDFDAIKPMDKTEARNILGIGVDKKVLIHVGRFDRAKGFDLVLQVYRELKKIYDVELVAIGGLKTDPLYGAAIESGAIVREWLPQSMLVPYYSASDVYLFPKFFSKGESKSIEQYMGTGVSPLEAMACGIPVVGMTLNYFEGSAEEAEMVGIAPPDVESVSRCVMDVIEHTGQYRECREITRKYYSWEAVVPLIVGLYDELLEEYYGKRGTDGRTGG